MRCKDCRKSCNHEYYMVRDLIWHIVKGGRDFLCILCLEARLGRKLKKEDFNDATLNSMPTQSMTVSERSGRKFDPSCNW